MELIAQFGLFNGSLALILIIAYSVRNSTRNRIFLGLSLFFVWYTLFVVILTITKQILNYPYFHRTGIITAYLAFPFLYIYSRNTFYPGRLWRGKDWFFLVPAVVYIIDYMPYFILPSNEKIRILQENISNSQRMLLAGEGWLGLTGFYFPFAYVWIAIIMYFQARLINANRNLRSGFDSPHNRRLFNFIVTITLLYVPLFLPGIFGILFKLSWFNANFIGLTFGLSLSAISIYLFISPDIVYGFIPERKFSAPVPLRTENAELVKSSSAIKPVLTEIPQPETEKESNKKIDIDETATNEREIAAELSIVVEHMEKEKPFLKQGFTIQDLSNQTSIPVYQLSPLINGHFKMNFANWVNRYRIEYFIQQVPENPQLTLEALSKKSGFISRSTFINAFKKEKGTTPREFFKDLKLSA
jgi:AraC-like DNA-binding protein